MSLGPEQKVPKTRNKMTNNYLQIYSLSLAIRKMQIKITLRFHVTQVRMVKVNGTITTSAGGEVGRGKPSFTVDGITN